MTLRTISKPARRAGMMLPIVLLTLLVVMLIGAALANSLVAQRRQSRHAERQQQTLWLVESAAQRAAYHLRLDPGYAGETWQAPGNVLGLGGLQTAGVAVVQVELVEGEPARRRVVIQATYPANSRFRTRYDREFVVAVPAATSDSP